MRAVGGELVHASVAVAVGDEHLARPRERDVRRQVEGTAPVCDLAIGGRAGLAGIDAGVRAEALGADRAEQLSLRREVHHLPVIAIDEPQVVVRIHADGVRKREQPGAHEWR